MLLSHSHLFEIRRCLHQGGLCIIPSDTCYILSGIPMMRGVGRDIRIILGREGQALSVTFGSQVMAERFIEFNRAALQVMDDFTPGPATIVLPLRSDLPHEVAARLNEALNSPKREIAIRFPDSAVELQVSSELERPITTTAIRYRDDSPVKNFDDAVDIVAHGIAKHEIKRELCAVRRRFNQAASGLSTVVEPSVHAGRGGSKYTIHREGEISEQQIRRSLAGLDRYILRDLDEWA
jgi:tRNA A37 threonylcarbamoyladenosine synthetase subunit TsaC/SUA5/YrdC